MEDIDLNHFINEILNEEPTKTREITEQMDLNNLEIAINQEGIKTTKCGKQKTKRRRKSLRELREVIGQAKE